MTIDSIQNGFVLDHIPAGKAIEIYYILNLGSIDGQVALIQNAKSALMGKKDVLKIATEDFDIDLDAVACICPKTTVNIIKNGKAVEKRALALPKKLVGITQCENPSCITNHESICSQFDLVDEIEKIYRCVYCETAANI